MNLTSKQRAVIAFALANNNRLTKQQAMEIPAVNTHYCNGAKHVGHTLSRMVKAGLLIREKPGVFVIGSGTRNKPARQDDNQQSLF